MKKILGLLFSCCVCSAVQALELCVPNFSDTDELVCVDFLDHNSILVTTTKYEISNVTVKFCSGGSTKFDSLSGVERLLDVSDIETILSVCVKAGNNTDGTCSGAPGNSGGQQITHPDPLRCDEGSGDDDDDDDDDSQCRWYDDCGICEGDNSLCAGCDGIPNSGKVEDECGVCDGPGVGECGCDLSIIKDECGVCGGQGAGPCGCGIDKDSTECLDCSGVPFGTNSKDINGTCCQQWDKDECNICYGSGKDSCGFCGNDSQYGKNSCECITFVVPNMEMDQLSSKILKRSSRISKVVSHLGSKKSKSSLTTLQGIHLRIWEIVWIEIGPMIKTCPDDPYCNSKDLVLLRDQINEDLGLVEKIVRQNVRFAKRKGKNLQRLRKRISKDVLELRKILSLLPDTKTTTCT